MQDRRSFRKKYLLGLLSSPWTLLPLLGGLTVLMGAWALGVRSGGVFLVGLAAVLGGIGAFLTRLVMGDEKTARNALNELRQEAKRSLDTRLDALDRRLRADGDARTERLLRDLRALWRALGDPQRWSNQLNARSVFDLSRGVEELFLGCVGSLEATLGLWETAAGMSTPEARRPILARRERMIEEVRVSVEKLGQILAGIESLESTSDSDAQLARVRQELDENLAVARRVQERIRRWDEDVAERA